MNLKRVYYSSYIPVVQSTKLPAVGAGLLREHRLYQADWLIRFYGFDVSEICGEDENLSKEYVCLVFCGARSLSDCSLGSSTL